MIEWEVLYELQRFYWLKRTVMYATKRTSRLMDFLVKGRSTYHVVLYYSLIIIIKMKIQYFLLLLLL